MEKFLKQVEEVKTIGYGKEKKPINEEKNKKPKTKNLKVNGKGGRTRKRRQIP
jgi:hypothetical protein